MDNLDLLDKLAQIEEQAKYALAEHPHLSKERLRMIVALARYLRTEHGAESSAPPSDAGLSVGQGDEPNARSA